MEHLHVLPNVSYLAKVRNTDRDVTFPVHGEHDGLAVHEEGNKKEETPAKH
jgi:hypothetical protein